MTAAAQASDDWGFCPVTKFPSTQTFEFQSSALSYFPPISFNFASSMKGTTSWRFTAISSESLKPVTTLSFTSGVPSGFLHWGRAVGPWQTAATTFHKLGRERTASLRLDSNNVALLLPIRSNRQLGWWRLDLCWWGMHGWWRLDPYWNIEDDAEDGILKTTQRVNSNMRHCVRVISLLINRNLLMRDNIILTLIFTTSTADHSELDYKVV